jgi:hypothetical protein
VRQVSADPVYALRGIGNGWWHMQEARRRGKSTGGVAWVGRQWNDNGWARGGVEAGESELYVWGVLLGYGFCQSCPNGQMWQDGGLRLSKISASLPVEDGYIRYDRNDLILF